MGETKTSLKVQANKKVAELEAIVDTGATFTKIPANIASKLGLQAQYETKVELRDGRVIKRGLTLVELEIEGIKRPILVTIGERREKPVIGYTTLEILGFKVNPVTGKLEKAVPIEYYLF